MYACNFSPIVDYSTLCMPCNQCAYVNIQVAKYIHWSISEKDHVTHNPESILSLLDLLAYAAD